MKHLFAFALASLIISSNARADEADAGIDESADAQAADSAAETTAAIAPQAAQEPADYAVPRGTTSAAHRVTESSPMYAGFEIFARYNARITRDADDDSWFHELDIPRVHASIEGEWSIARARIVLEGLRSSSEGALVGVAGDSFVVRLREAWAQVALWEQRIELRGGIVPNLTVPAIESVWRLRAVAATPLEENHLAFASDLGGTATLRLPKRYGWIGLGFYNGEGYASRELNRGKNIEGAIEVHPLASIDAAAPLAVFASYVEGSSGTGSARANRLTAGLLWRDTAISGGASFTYAWGLQDDASRLGWMFEAFVRAELFNALLLGARGVHFVRSIEARDQVTTLVGTVGYRVVDPLEVFFAVQQGLPNQQASTATPGLETTELSLVVRAIY